MNFFDATTFPRKAEIFALDFIVPAVYHFFPHYELREYRCENSVSGRADVSLIFKTEVIDQVLDDLKWESIRLGLCSFSDKSAKLSFSGGLEQGFHKIPDDPRPRGYYRVTKHFTIHPGLLRSSFTGTDEEFTSETLIAEVLKVQEQQVNLMVKRLGGLIKS